MYSWKLFCFIILVKILKYAVLILFFRDTFKGRSRRFWCGSENLGYPFGIHNPPKKCWPRSPVVRKTPLFPLGKHHKRPLLGNTPNDHFWGNTTNNQFLQDFSVQPFLNGTKIIVLLQYVEKSCRNWSFVVFPQGDRLWCFPEGNKVIAVV